MHILLLYWIETGVIGAYTLVKIVIEEKFGSLFLVPFFILHFGGFMYGHLVFLLAIFGSAREYTGALPPIETMIPLVAILAFPIAILFVSHGVSFFTNYIGKKEYARKDSDMTMLAPYKRVVVMHLTIILGAFWVAITGEYVYGLVLLVILKTGVDLWAHIREHA